MSCNFLTVKVANWREIFMDCFPAADSQHSLYVSIQPSGANNSKSVENLKKCRHKMFLISTSCTYILSLWALGLLLGLLKFFGPYVQNAVKQYRKCKMYAPYAYTASLSLKTIIFALSILFYSILHVGAKKIKKA